MVRDNGATVNLPLPSGDTVLFFRGIVDNNPFNCFVNSFIISYNVTSKVTKRPVHPASLY